jgi:hypothetical protein
VTPVVAALGTGASQAVPYPFLLRRTASTPGPASSAGPGRCATAVEGQGRP